MDASIRISFGCNIYHNHTFESSYGENSLSAIKNKKASLNVLMIASIGMMTILVNLIALFFGNETKVIDNAIQKTYTFGSIIVTTLQMYQAVFGAVSLSLLSSSFISPAGECNSGL